MGFWWMNFGSSEMMRQSNIQLYGTRRRSRELLLRERLFKLTLGNSQPTEFEEQREHYGGTIRVCD